MHPMSEPDVRAAFVNASRRETSELQLPDWFGDADWASLDYLGWRDAKLPRRAYVVVPTLLGEPVGILLTAASAAPRTRALCSWCRDVRLPNDVVMYVAKRAGPAGRKGDTVGTLVCESFECSRNVRLDPPLPYEGFDQDVARQERVDILRLRAAGFADTVLHGS